MGSIFKRDTVIRSVPAFDVVEREPGSDGAVNLTAGETLIRDGQYGTYTINSAVSYALECGRDPIADYQRAVDHGHDTHWIDANCTVLTAHDAPRERHIQVAPGMLVRFEGRLFTIETSPNNNLRLAPAA